MRSLLSSGRYRSQILYLLSLSLCLVASSSSLKDYDTLLTVINVSDKEQVINLTDFIDRPRQLVVEIAGVDSRYETG